MSSISIKESNCIKRIKEYAVLFYFKLECIEKNPIVFFINHTLPGTDIEIPIIALKFSSIF